MRAQVAEVPVGFQPGALVEPEVGKVPLLRVEVPEPAQVQAWEPGLAEAQPEEEHQEVRLAEERQEVRPVEAQPAERRVQEVRPEVVRPEAVPRQACLGPAAAASTSAPAGRCGSALRCPRRTP